MNVVSLAEERRVEEAMRITYALNELAPAWPPRFAEMRKLNQELARVLGPE